MSFDSNCPIICSIIASMPSSPGPAPTPPIPGRKLEKSDGPDICDREGHTLTPQHTQEVTCCVVDYTSMGYANMPVL